MQEEEHWIGYWQKELIDIKRIMSIAYPASFAPTFLALQWHHLNGGFRSLKKGPWEFFPMTTIALGP
jgi:hypothetical protein